MILTISIPTYQRPDFLLKTLHSVAGQIADSKSVSIQVFDDSAGEQNIPIIERIRGDYPELQLVYERNPVNLGIDENIKKCIRAAVSDYVWLLGEDDLLTPGAVDLVLKAIAEHRPPFIFANYIYANDQHSAFAASAVLPERNETDVVEFNDFIKKDIWALGFIGGCVIRRVDWCDQDVSVFAGSFYSHVGGIIGSCVNRKIAVIHSVLVLNRAEDINTFTWSSSTFPVYFSFFDVIESSRLRENRELQRIARMAATKLFNIYGLSWLAAKRADGVYNAAVFSEYYRQNANPGLLWKASAYAISVFPRAPLRWLRTQHLTRRFSRDAI